MLSLLFSFFWPPVTCCIMGLNLDTPCSSGLFSGDYEGHHPETSFLSEYVGRNRQKTPLLGFKISYSQENLQVVTAQKHHYQVKLYGKRVVYKDTILDQKGGKIYEKDGPLCNCAFSMRDLSKGINEYVLVEMGLDSSDLPMGMLTDIHIKRCEETLLQFAEKLKEKKEIGDKTSIMV